ncbi:MAG TPA: exosortase/archaeosortase family protein [Gemmataceae bacterium]|nr:exosortase/archaeosortase family protein [Gemmataceae bacterium]
MNAQPATHAAGGRPWFPWAALAVGTAAVVWAWWATLGELAARWGHDPQYSHGYLVPAFAVLLLWLRRDRLAGATPAPSAWGAPVLAAGLALRLVGGYFHYVWFDAVSLVPVLAGLWLLVGGRAVWRWAWPALLFLAFMVPLPFRVAGALSGPLQRVATVASTFALQTIGLPAVAEGNVILLDEAEIGVVEACSGLRMLVVFFALSTGLALVVRRPLWERLLVVASAAPIALAVNIARITATGVLHETVGSRLANLVFHDLAGWLMMPLALALLALELAYLRRLVLDGPPARGTRPAAAR